MDKNIYTISYGGPEKQSLSRVQKITLSAMLTALSFAYLFIVPTIDLGVWSFTPFSHLFIFLAAFISPYTAFMTYAAVLLGFFLKTANQFIWLRAASHIFFVTALVATIKIKPIKGVAHFTVVALIIGVIHGVMEALSVFIGLAWLSGNDSAYYIIGVVGGGGFVHSMIDIFAAYLIFLNLKRIFKWL
jgi:hypothetical protein